MLTTTLTASSSMQAVRQSFLAKHQVLILKCYPKYQKNVQDVKPNSSELSYLLYYASTRRSKLQKVGAFLEKRTASDIWRNKIGYAFETDIDLMDISASVIAHWNSADQTKAMYKSHFRFSKLSLRSFRETSPFTHPSFFVYSATSCALRI